MRNVSWVGMVAVLVSMPMCAQQTGGSQAPESDTTVLLQKIRDLEDRVISLEGQVRVLKSEQQPAAPPPAAEAAAPGAVPTEQLPPPAPPAGETQSAMLGGAGGSAAKALNPDISAIGDFISVAGHNPVQPSPSLQMHESELGIQAIIDPYARGDFFLSFGEEGVDVEEGYITFTALPGGFVAKAGKMRAAFGKVNTMHNHVLPWWTARW